MPKNWHCVNLHSLWCKVIPYLFGELIYFVVLSLINYLGASSAFRVYLTLLKNTIRSIKIAKKFTWFSCILPTFRWIWIPLCKRATTILVECRCSTTVLIVVVDAFGAGILSELLWLTEFTYPKGVRSSKSYICTYISVVAHLRHFAPVALHATHRRPFQFSPRNLCRTLLNILSHHQLIVWDR